MISTIDPWKCQHGTMKKADSMTTFENNQRVILPPWLGGKEMQVIESYTKEIYGEKSPHLIYGEETVALQLPDGQQPFHRFYVLASWLKPKPKPLPAEPGLGEKVIRYRVTGKTVYVAREGGARKQFVRVTPGADSKTPDRHWFMVEAPQSNRKGEVEPRWYTWEELNA